MSASNNTSKNLILLTNFFPYGSAEPYLETEVKYYDDYFDHIYVCSLQLRPTDFASCRKIVSQKFKILPIFKASNLVYLLYAFRVLGDCNLYKELRKLFSEHRLSFRNIVLLFVYLSRSYYEAGKIYDWLKAEGVLSQGNSGGVIYSYRFEYQPYVGLILKRYLPNYVTLSRGHGFDLYEFRRGGYIPLREYLLDSLNYTVMIGKAGVDYLSKKYPDHVSKVVLSRLGTLDYGLGPVPDTDGPIRIVSCSSIIGLKRIDLIVHALSLIKDVDVIWEHYGDGPNRNMVEDMAQKELGPNVRSIFKGQVDNASLMDMYSKTAYHVFINVSTSEGVPVSIMEALSFGIPAIATDVGGTSEIVFDKKNGLLLPSDFEPKQLVACIMEIYQDYLSPKRVYRLEARKLWEDNYSADVNYPHFISKFMSCS
jgi:glycosyltransferase involved in cell wall biosynthesis